MVVNTEKNSRKKTLPTHLHFLHYTVGEGNCIKLINTCIAAISCWTEGLTCARRTFTPYGSQLSEQSKPDNDIGTLASFSNENQKQSSAVLKSQRVKPEAALRS